MPSFRRAAWALPFILPMVASGQQAALSRSLTRNFPPDTVLVIWLFGRPQFSMAQLESALASLGGKLRRESRWLHAISAELMANAIPRARRRPEFRRLQPVARFTRPPEPPPVAARTAPRSRDGLDSTYGASAMPFRRLDL